jgi:hypothetical protein
VGEGLKIGNFFACSVVEEKQVCSWNINLSKISSSMLPPFCSSMVASISLAPAEQWIVSYKSIINGPGKLAWHKYY